MTPHFAAHSVPVGRVLAAPFCIETPAYQRAFVWEPAEAGRLLDDLTNAAETAAAASASGQEAPEVADFLGAILLVDRDEAASSSVGWPFSGPLRAFEVVDGLQRLTTLCILLCVLRDIAADNGEPANARVDGAISLDSAPALSLRGGDEVFFQACVRAAPGAPRENVEPDSPAQERLLAVREMFRKALSDMDASQRTRLARFLLDQCYVVLVTTTGIDRAHRMFMVLNERGKPLARNDILKADTLGRAGAASRTVSDLWDAMEKQLGHDFEMLFSHLRAMYGKPNGPIISSIRAIAENAGGAQTFVAQILKPAADAFDDIRSSRGDRWPQGKDVSERLGYLHWLPANDWVPPTMQYWLSAGQRNGDMLEFLQAMDRLAYGLKILGVGAGKRGTRFAAVTAAIRRGEPPLAPGGPLTLSGAEERAVRYNLRDIHARAPIVAKLILMRINDRIAGRPLGIAPETLTVEHVLPRKHNVNSQWRRWFEDPAVRTACTESLGNLLLVTKAQNERAGNQELAQKVAVYFAPGQQTLVVNEGLRGATTWQPEQVLAREQMLHGHVDAIWNFGLTAQDTSASPPQAVEATGSAFGLFRRTRSARG
jgi:hypothetical protein